MSGKFTVGHVVTAAELNSMVGIRGWVQITSATPTASIAVGSGFTVTMSNGQNGTITFTSSMTTYPVITFGAASGYGHTVIVNLTAFTTSGGNITGFSFVVMNDDGTNPTNAQFFFQAIQADIGS
ncbi:hypothetical protein UFOVP1186_16 [uncultured Caudovirales phage]|uniref:Uncharacterized protein n=1 Tax=uncultured Caudovirales phage TaxID=2100421 RepID=A0A6J7XWY6_9CAUD|nr:hypothetical protein UFOVP959_8 [uncultured Caudovirales phage]CAB4189310.1 hypothetical protein UFOVP1186_16 [uncultured Caudovirales phage]CAB4192133.1 hypothetical protein UFOVP1234_3 [uncultured Caudovirales phage]CAB4215442.1 hypothetical protein UFOVP1487_16 [uncultured Caudovirales phage]CAB5238946.1 hypothetical protein UFOVP1574_38 [uncultured Caudovirales phage]